MENSSKRILIVDDDAQLRKMLRRYLESEGFAVSEASDATSAQAALSDGIDLVTLDLNLGRTDGLDIARKIRAHSDLPIVIITGKGDVLDRVVGLEIGADDYISKPFNLREVLARIRTVLRRSAGAKPTEDEESGGRIRFDGFNLDTGRRALTDADGRAVELTSGEFDLLRVFAARPHRVLSRDQLMDLLKGHDWAPTDRSIDNQIARLRRKIETDTSAPQLIKTVRGVGYSFTPSEISKS